MAQSVSMVRKGSKKWWEQGAVVPLEMAYECDTRLGSPSAADCTQVEWEQVRPASDTLKVGPGLVTFLHSSKQAVSCFAVCSVQLTLAA